MKAKQILFAFALSMAAAAGAHADSTANAGSAAGADSASSSGANAAITLNSHSYGVKQDYPSASAASLLIQSCQEGASATGLKGGIAAGFDSAQCVAIRQAAVHLEMYDRYFALGMHKQANEQLAKFHKYLAYSEEAAKIGHYPKVAGGALTSVLPIALLFLVF